MHAMTSNVDLFYDNRIYRVSFLSILGHGFENRQHPLLQYSDAH